MGKYHRYRFPHPFRRVIVVVEYSVVPILCYQILRTLFLPTTLDMFLCILFIGMFVMFQSKWI